jgi:hypothetical protein
MAAPVVSNHPITAVLACPPAKSKMDHSMTT